MLHTDIATVEYSPCDSNNKDYCCLFFFSLYCILFIPIESYAECCLSDLYVYVHSGHWRLFVIFFVF